MKYVITMFQSTSDIIKLTAKSDPQWKLLRWKVKLRCQNAWYLLFFIQNIFIVGVIMPSISNSWKSIETKWYPVPYFIDTKDSDCKKSFNLSNKNFIVQKSLKCKKFANHFLAKDHWTNILQLEKIWFFHIRFPTSTIIFQIINLIQQQMVQFM